MSVDEHLACFHILAIITNAVMKTGVQLFLDVGILLPLDIHPEVELLDYMVALFLAFEKPSYCLKVDIS